MYCPNCGTNTNSNFCPNCGTNLTNLPKQPRQQASAQVQAQRASQPQQAQWNGVHTKIPGTFIPTSTCRQVNADPVKGKSTGLILFWCLGGVFLYIILFAIIVSSCSSGSDTKSIVETAGVSSEIAEDIWSVLKDNGISSIGEITYDQNLDNMNESGEKGYWITMAGSTKILLYLSASGNVNRIELGASTLYSDGIHHMKWGDINKAADKVKSATGLDADLVINIGMVLIQCGINPVDSMEYDSTLDGLWAEGEKGYRIKSNGINIILYIYDNGITHCVRYADNNLYEDGNYYNKLTDYYLTTTQQTNLMLRSEETINMLLKSPSTSKFPNILEWRFGRNPDEITVQSYVDAQNSFGATVRSEFQIIYKPDGVTPVSIIVDGKEYL